MLLSLKALIFKMLLPWPGICKTAFDVLTLPTVYKCYNLLLSSLYQVIIINILRENLVFFLNKGCCEV